MTQPVEIAYAAGLFDGEGTVHLDRNGRVLVQIQMTDREPLERMRSIFGGPLMGPHQPKRGGRPRYTWRHNGWEFVERFFELTHAWLSPRRTEQFAAIFARKPPPERLGRGAHNRIKTRCPKGHVYDHTVVVKGVVKRRCSTCQNDRRRQARAIPTGGVQMEASSAVNTPHPDAPADDAEDFFGQPGEPAPVEEAPAAAESAPESTAAVNGGSEEPAPAADATEPPSERQRGSVDREYIVFQRIKLTKENLKALLAEVEAGTAGKIRHAFFELHRSTARTDKLAVAEAYKHHHAALGETADVAAVSARSFKERHIEPDEIPAERRLRIT